MTHKKGDKSDTVTNKKGDKTGDKGRQKGDKEMLRGPALLELLETCELSLISPVVRSHCVWTPTPQETP